MRSFILGTDWCTDCDDAVAMRVICRAHKAGEIKLLGIGINTCVDVSVSSLYGFLATEGVTDVAVGIDKKSAEARNFEPKYQPRLATYAPDKANEDAEDAVRMYRRLIANSPTRVEILEIGFTQVIAGALMSQPDDISPLSGIELFRQKVAKVWMMAGKWDEEGGKEYNFCCHQLTSTNATTFCDNCPIPVTFLGWEIGNTVISGNELADGDVLKQVLIDHGSPNGRSSWDPMLVLLAIIGDEKAAGYSVTRGRARVEAADGSNYFTENAAGPHQFVTKLFEDSYYQKQINERIS